MIRKREE